jgi:hypothetical protein
MSPEPVREIADDRLAWLKLSAAFSLMPHALSNHRFGKLAFAIELVLALGQGILAGPFAQYRFVHHANPDRVAEEADRLLRARQPARVPVDDHAVEAVVYKDRQAGKQLCDKFYRSPVLRSCLDNPIAGRAPGGIKISNMFG